jgi:hypothetical protein
MTIATDSLSASLQTLIDSRLDTIDRMLLGRVARQDRLAIVREVESQIFELLQGRGEAGDLTRDDVLTVLASLDPPEAYLPEGPLGETSSARVTAPGRFVTPARSGDLRAAKAAGIVGIATLVLVAFSPLIVIGSELTESEAIALILWFGTVGTVVAGGVTAIALAAYGRLRGAWAVTGLVTGILSVLAAIAGGIFLLLEL